MPYINLSRVVEGWMARLLVWCRVERGNHLERLCVVAADKRQAFELCRTVLQMERPDGNITFTDTSVVLINENVFQSETHPETFITSKNGVLCFQGLKAQCLYKAYPIAFYGVAMDRLDVLGGVLKYYQLAFALTPLHIVDFGPVWISEEQLAEPIRSNGHFSPQWPNTHTHTLSNRGLNKPSEDGERERKHETYKAH